MSLDLNGAAAALLGNDQLCDEALFLGMGGCTLRLQSNSGELIEGLRSYFSHVVVAPGAAELEIVAIERGPPDPGVVFRDWAREPGKSGRKDAYFDLRGGRLVRKVRTGMLFLQSEAYRIAAGPCLENDNQVINFINAQYMNWLQQRGWLICHAAGLVYRGRCLGIAGFSGGGKSTLMLHLLAREGVAYLTNDRLFIRREGNGVQALGIPKLPRINPGTIVHNERLHGLIPAAERAALLTLPSGDLWQIEDKYDVPIATLYGPGKILPAAPITSFLILNWAPRGERPLEVSPVDPGQRRDLLGAIMKSPGPFYQYADGSFHQDSMPFDEAGYLQVLEGVRVYEASGSVDFDGLIGQCLDGIMG